MTTDTYPTNQTYRPLTSAIPPEQSEKLTGASLVALSAEPEKKEEPVIPVQEPPKQEVESGVEEPQVVETPEPEKVVTENLEIDSPLGKVEIPTEKKVEKKPEVVEEDDDDKAWQEVAGSQTKQKKAFINLRRSEKEAKTLRTQNEELQRQLQEAQSKAPEVRPDPEIQKAFEALQSEHKKAQERLQYLEKDAAVFRVEQSDEYKAKVDRPFHEEIQPVMIDLTKATNGQVNKATFDALAQMDPVQYREEMRKIKEQLEPGDYQELAAAVPKYREVIKANTELRQNADKIIALKQREMEDQQANWEKDYRAELDTHLAKKDAQLDKQFFAGLDDPELKEIAKNAKVQIASRVKDFNIFKASPEDHAALLAGAVNYPVITAIMGRQISTLQQQIADKDKQIKELTTAQDKLTKASPGAGVTTTGATKAKVEPEEFTGKLDGKTLLKMAGD